jgi:hypothetical protein
LSRGFSGIFGKLQNSELIESTGKGAKEGESPVSENSEIFLA